MLQDSMIESGGKKKATRKWITFPVSLLVHAIAILALIVIPLMTADSDLPEIEIFDVFMTSAPPRLPPRLHRLRRKEKKVNPRRKLKKKKPNANQLCPEDWLLRSKSLMK